MPFTGSCYTWCNGRRGLHRIHRRLDRALCNGVCLDEWESCSYHVLDKKISDHSPILASLTSNSLRKVSNFRFFSMWLQDTSCLKLIHDSWANQVSCNEFLDGINTNDLSCMPLLDLVILGVTEGEGCIEFTEDWIGLM